MIQTLGTNRYQGRKKKLSNEKEVEQNLILEVKSDERLWTEMGNKSNVCGAETSESTSIKTIRGALSNILRLGMTNT